MTAGGAFRLIETGHVWVGSLEGEIDVSNATDIGEQIIDVVSNEPIGVVLDVSKVRYLDSSGLGLLFGLRRALDARRQGLVLIVPESSRLHRLFTVASLDSVIPIRPSLPEAKLLAQAAQSDSHPA